MEPVRRDSLFGRLFEGRIRHYGSRLFGMFSTGFGILSIMVGLLPCINIIAVGLGIAGIIMGILSLRSTRYRVRHAYGVLGIVLSVIGIVFSIALTDYALKTWKNRDSIFHHEKTVIPGRDY